MTIERTFVFADLAGYTALTEAHGDDDAAQIATRFHEIAGLALRGDARMVKTIGDAVMLVATTCVDAIDSSLALAWEVAASRTFPAVRIGIHLGSAVERDGDYFGGAVNIAARVSCMARGGEIVCTAAIAEAAVAHARATARPMGTYRLKNVATPVALYELESAADASRVLAHIDPVCRMQVTAEEAVAHAVHDGAPLYFCSAQCAMAFGSSPESYLPTR